LLFTSDGRFEEQYLREGGRLIFPLPEIEIEQAARLHEGA
jgi:hypothetical protein